MRPAAVGFHCPEEQTRPRRANLPGWGRRPRRGLLSVTGVLVLLNVVAYLFEGAPISTDARFNTFTQDTTLVPFLVAHGDYYRLLSAAFIHYSIFHIGLNMLALVFVGPPVEALLGKSRFLAVYLLCAVGGNVAVYLFSPLVDQDAGASGAIFGLFAMLFILARRVGADTSAIVITIVVNLVFTLTFPGVSVWGHLGGLATGAVTGAGLVLAGRRSWAAWAVLAVVALVLVLAAVARTAALTG